jgi:hypothetical protein
MGKISLVPRIPAALILLACVISMAECPLALSQTATPPADGEQSGATPPSESPLIIENDSELPDTYPRAHYEVRFHARGGVPVLHWRLEKGALPPGFKLDDSGLLHGEAERTGEFQFTLAVNDGGNPQQAVQKGFVLRVRSALTLNWKNPARVAGNRIQGSVEVTNTTPDDMDLTFVVMAVAGNGRATAIGYQHFVLTRGTIGMELPFGETLPQGGYMVHVDAVGEVAAKNLIYRERMQTPGPLHVNVGP